jgi:protein-S-isoprenylcysteine O-methyltransferase Ste14
MIRFLNLAAWLACVIYSTIPAFWLAIHPFADRWRKRRRSPYRVLMPLWVLLWLVVGMITARWRAIAFYQSSWVWLPASFLFCAGVWIYRHAGKNFSGKQLGGVPEVHRGRQEQRLVTSGIRARVRHPVYLGHLCEMVAWSVGSGLAVCYGLTAFALVSGGIMIRLEDAELEQRFGDAYRVYRATVPSIVPRFSRLRQQGEEASPL